MLDQFVLRAYRATSAAEVRRRQWIPTGHSRLFRETWRD